MKKTETIFITIIKILLGVSIICGCSGKKSIEIKNESKPMIADSVKVRKAEKIQKKDTWASIDSGLSPASELMIRACDNYLALSDSGQKAAEVLNIKASMLYKKKLYEWSRSVYNQILEKYQKTAYSYDAMQMIAQSYYEEKRFNEAQEWYRKLSYAAQSVPDKEDALRRIAESIFRMAESYDDLKKYKDAAVEYERVALEFPESKIADVSLFNAGLAYEKLTDWTHAILIFQRLLQKYTQSPLLPKAQFRIAKNHEKMLQWDYAAEAYLKVALDYTGSEMGPLALYNAGFCFESAGKLKEAAATFEKLANLYPLAPDAPDVLFKAGEIYGKIKDWSAVTRVNQTFTNKFGSDQDRIIQALCMGGIAFYMQNREEEAIKQLEKAVITFGRMKEPSSVNSFYAAKALYTIGEIYHEQMTKIDLSDQRSIYKKQLDQKSSLLNQAIEAYSKVVKFSISEWTTRAVFQIGKIYEDFGISIFRQQRPSYNSLEERMSLELGIAQAVEKYFVDKSLYYHELNVKLGIKEEIEDKYITQSRQKLTSLPYMAGENYLALVQIIKNSMGVNLDGLASVAITLQTLQRVAPFQEKAIDLYLKCLELGSKYQEKNEFYNKAASTITGQSFLVGETYDKVVTIAREAPIPQSFSQYESFVYKTKLLKQVESYEEQALTHYLKTLKIADAYKILDESVKESQKHIAKLLFNKGWSYDLLATFASKTPPFPEGIGEEEKDEFRGRFLEIGTKFSSQAVEIYKTLLDFASQRYASGEHVNHAYMRLYQISPDKYGVADIQTVKRIVTADSIWKCSVDSAHKWIEYNLNDSSWKNAVAIKYTDGSITGNPDVPAEGLSCSLQSSDSIGKIFFRRKFTTEAPCSSALIMFVTGKVSVFINGKKLLADTIQVKNLKALKWELEGTVITGENILAIEVEKKSKSDLKMFPVLYIWEEKQIMVPKFPLNDQTLVYDAGKQGVYKFPFLKNFSIDNNGEHK